MCCVYIIGFANLERKIFAINLLRDYSISFADEKAADSTEIIFRPLLCIKGKLVVKIKERKKQKL